MLVGLVGKPNVGKSTFFSAATLAPAEVANYPFTTIDANRGVAFVRFEPCPHTLIDKECTPRSGACVDGVRLVPVELLDVAGLVPGAHEGKGLGNKFLSDLATADALVHVVDASGGTNAEGEPVPPGTHDPVEDVKFLEEEITHWIKGIIQKGFDRAAKGAQLTGKKIEGLLHERVTGLGITEAQVSRAYHASGLGTNPLQWSDEEFYTLAAHVRRMAKPIIIAANKAEIAPPENLEKLRALENYTVVPTSAESELALRRAAEHGLIEYVPGASSFTITAPEKLTDAQKKALERIQTEVLDALGSTGIQKVIETAVFDVLDRIVAFPVEDETHLTDGEGRILPDAILLRNGATAKDLAFKVHTDLGEHFIRAVDARTKRTVGADHALATGDVVRIVAHK